MHFAVEHFGSTWMRATEKSLRLQIKLSLLPSDLHDLIDFLSLLLFRQGTGGTPTGYLNSQLPRKIGVFTRQD